MMSLKKLGLGGSLLLLSLGGCTLFGDQDPEIGTIQIEGTAGDSVSLVISTEFVAGPNEAGDTVLVEVLRADTLREALPYDARVDVSEFDRLLVRIFESHDADAMVRMRVSIDGDLKYDQSSVIAERILQFVFVFNQGAITAEPRL